jgi:hypothetical protein
MVHLFSGNIEQTINYHNKKVTFHNDMKDQWLGMTLDVEPNNHSSVMVSIIWLIDSYRHVISIFIDAECHMIRMIDADVTWLVFQLHSWGEQVFKQ